MKVFGGKRWAFGLVAIGICCGFAGLSFSRGLDEKKVVTVRAEDIPDKVQIIGRLGQPLGSLLRIRGTWVMPRSKEDCLYFNVALVNGKKSDKKVDFAINVVVPIDNLPGGRPKPGGPWDWRVNAEGSEEPWASPSQGEAWEMLGVETG